MTTNTIKVKKVTSDWGFIIRHIIVSAILSYILSAVFSFILVLGTTFTGLSPLLPGGFYTFLIFSLLIVGPVSTYLGAKWSVIDLSKKYVAKSNAAIVQNSLYTRIALLLLSVITTMGKVSNIPGPEQKDFLVTTTNTMRDQSIYAYTLIGGLISIYVFWHVTKKFIDAEPKAENVVSK